MNYREAVKQSMENLANDERTVFIGYNISYGSKAYGTLVDVSEEKKIEMPVAENLMTGIAIGMSLEGFLPVLYFERHDFMLIALDALLNHLDKIEKMSKGEYKPKVIVRAVVGATKPLDPGPQHTQDLSETFKKLFSFPVFEPKTSEEVLRVYEEAKRAEGPVMIIEKKDLYEKE